jgi:para-nitrobenzyl esterase
MHGRYATDSKRMIAARLFLGLIIVGAVSTAGCGGSSANANKEPPAPLEHQADISEGRVDGSIEGELLVFRGVRYAAPLTPENRFIAPQDPLPIDGTYNAMQFGPACAQPSGGGMTGAEDCLFANIWAHRDAKLRPVIVYVHGGRKNGANAVMPAIDSANLAKATGAIIVTVNRRLGVLGYLALEELIAEKSTSHRW